MFLIAAGLGAVGGIAYELLQARGTDAESGALELPGRRPGRRFYDFGFLSSMLVGAVAAVAAAFFFTPEVQEKVTVNGVEQIKTRWQIVRLVPLSLIVGSAGGAFLTAAQARVVVQVTEADVKRTQAVAAAATTQLVEAGRTAAAQVSSELAAKVQPAVTQAVHAAASETPAKAKPEEHVAEVQDALERATTAAIEDLGALLEGQAKAAQATIAAAASPEQAIGPESKPGSAGT